MAMATPETAQTDENREAYRMVVLDEDLYKAVRAALFATSSPTMSGGEVPAILALALQDVAEVKREVAEVREKMKWLEWILLEHSHNDRGGAVVPVGGLCRGPSGGARGRPVEHRYVRRLAEACEDAARLGEASAASGQGPQV